MKRLKFAGYLVWITGLVLFLWLLVAQGLRTVLNAVIVAGWGICIVPLGQAVPMLSDALAWRRLLAPGQRPPLWVLFRIRWIGESVNNLLPVAAVAGEFLRAWLLRGFARIPGANAGASVIGDMTAGIAGQCMFTAMGIALAFGVEGRSDLVSAAAVGCGLLCLLVAGFYTAQRAGLFAFSSQLVVRVIRKESWLSLVGTGRALDAQITALYARRWDVFIAVGWRFAGWCAGAIEVWMGFYFLGHPLTFTQALMVESLLRAVRSAAFMIPGALGIQEGALIVLGGAVGAAPDVALALALLKRARELAWGIPGLLYWQFSHLHKVWVGRARGLDDSVALQRHQE
ncbi:MAG: flippase-like domain-containing protein [Gammaproteobacteria bacterium]